MVRERIHRLLIDARGDPLVAYRFTTLGLVVVAVAAAVLQGAVSAGTGLAALALIPVGFVVSYQRRDERNILLKVVLAAGVLVALAAFLDAVRGSTSVDDTRAPLAAIFVWTQVLHSFDVPKARDLSFSVASSVALIAFTGSLAFSTGFVLLVVLYAIWFAAALATGYHAELRSSAEGALAREVRANGDRPKAGLVRPASIVLAATLLCAALVLVFIPRIGSAQVVYLPFSFASKTPIPGFIGGVVNPGARAGPGSSTAFDPDAYFGYGQTVDLSARGRLSEELVLRVRAPRPSLYRAQAFDVYRDGVWTSSDDDLDDLRGNGTDPIDVPAVVDDRLGRTEQLVQTFYVERELPNVVFHAYRPSELYLPSTTVRMDDFTSLRLPFTLEEDTIYSVVSQVPAASADDLRSAPPVDTFAPGAARYLELPPSLSAGFRDLAQRITAPHPTAADKADAVETWLHRNKRYRLDIPRDPPGKDPIDVFVFDRDEGFCEQIAATMALMLRASGVPTRLVTGFGPGERNLFTGYWEVRNADAHAWVEVFYPGYGWIPYDPTFGVPSSTAANTTFMLEPVRRFFSALVPDFASRGIVNAFSGVLRTIGGPAFIAALALLVAAGVWARRTRRRRRRTGDDRVVDAWMELEAALGEHGLSRAPNETPRRFARRAVSALESGAMELNELADEFGRLRYGSPASVSDRVEQFERHTADAVQALVHTVR